MSPSGSIYVIDDDAEIRNSVSFLLEAAGFNVRLFESAQAFLDDLLNIDAGCILTDVRMPGIDGIELLKRMNAGAGLRRMPVIVMTGHGDVTLAVEAMKLGAHDFLEKPFEHKRLIDMIEAALLQGADRRKDEAIINDIKSRIDTLTDRERQVMRGLVTGLSNKLIAQQYAISHRTVEIYRANVMTKMHAGNLSELVRLVLRVNFLSD